MNYYSAIIKQYQERVGTDKELPRITIESINMYHMFRLLDAQQYEKIAGYVGAAANNLLKAGCDFGLICGNTPHLLFDKIQARTDLSLLSIVETAVAAAQQLHLQRLALLGTKFTMQNDFFIKPFREAGIEVCRPSEDDQPIIHQKIVDKLENGIVKKETKQQLMTIINKMVQKCSLGMYRIAVNLRAGRFQEHSSVWYCSGSNQSCCGSTSKNNTQPK